MSLIDEVTHLIIYKKYFNTKGSTVIKATGSKPTHLGAHSKSHGSIRISNTWKQQKPAFVINIIIDILCANGQPKIVTGLGIRPPFKAHHKRSSFTYFN